MPQVNVTIAGKAYRMACGEGEEQHLEALAAGFDSRIADMRKAFGEIGDMRLHVMAALTLADELAETKRRMEAMERETAALRESTEAGTTEREGAEARLAETVLRTAERIERLAKRLGPVPGGPQGG